MFSHWTQHGGWEKTKRQLDDHRKNRVAANRDFALHDGGKCQTAFSVRSEPSCFTSLL